ncbi:hypothetical protein K466DRAFT_594628 [Polyporus arcularius HHB13444]|uniref:Uncharacterized protein n=1 Tax=Polyporus arcularius HHB13444 TaxID=1314778 RepID=A0A5C3PZ78_9APHY|nr:hypothetical protein K466DRAFT_594628 [Polyporus arcularius HHB13444]
MAPASSTASSSATARHSAGSSSPTPTAITTVVDVTPSHSILTTTVTSGGSASLPTVGAEIQHRSSNVPIAAIAGGTAAGVVLALVLVVGWTWWGRCIKRKKAKERKEALAFLEVRENTRKNASSLSAPATQYRPGFSIRGHPSRKVQFVPSGASQSLQGTSEKKGSVDAEKSAQPAPTLRPPTPTAQLKGDVDKPEMGLPPPLPRKNPKREYAHQPSTAPTDVPPVQHRLAHQASTVSAASQYSTQSAVEERPSGVPSSLLLALTNEGNRRSLLAGYLPWNRYRTSVASNNRLSEYTTDSVYSQIDDQSCAWEPVGFAYGGEEEQPRR